nr:bifunctional pyr operon transcriptional regulator/uracil phosphoribosyltransferase PyrR [Ferroacidibacillus organovorans]
MERVSTVVQSVSLLDEQAIRRALTRIAHEVVEKTEDDWPLAIVGIMRKGLPLARRLAERIEAIEKRKVNVYSLDVTAYRDDQKQREGATAFAASGSFEPSALAGVPELGRSRVLLVDDVLYTGRTVRAALDALLSHARPPVIQLAVLIDRGHRELPIRPDYVGKNIPTARSERVLVRLREFDSEEQVILLKQTDARAEVSGGVMK